MINYEKERSRMVDEQIIGRGVKDERVLAVMRKIPRHEFLPEAIRGMAYGDNALPLGEGQTISQPYMVALMTEAIGVHGGEHVLEVGTGSGYQAAVLAELGVRVLTLERLPDLAAHARALLGALGYLDRVTVEVADGTLGESAGAPYDAILVTAAAPQIPRPLIKQLAPHGCLVLPMGEEDLQSLVRLRRGAEGLVEEYLGECRFVKLLGSYGWEDS